MSITKEYLQNQIKNCQDAKEQYLAQANANEGAINILNTLLIELDKPEEDKKTDG
jgi:hypothetical protein